MARKPLKPISLFEQSVSPAEPEAKLEEKAGTADELPAEPGPEAPKRRKRAVPERDETLYSCTHRLRMDQRHKLANAARERQRPTAPGKLDASEVLREFFDSCFDDWWAGQ